MNKVNRVLEPKVKALEEELHKAKTDLVSLELTCLHASIKTCENCKKLEKQVEYLLKTLSSFTKGRENLETLVGSQNDVFNKNGLGYWWAYIYSHSLALFIDYWTIIINKSIVLINILIIGFI